MSEKIYRIKIKLGQNEIELEGDKEWVEEKYLEFKTLVDSDKLTPSSHSELVSGIRPDASVPPEIPETLAQFYREKGEPKYHRDKVLIFSYWLTKVESMNSYNLTDINKCYSDLRITKPKNINDTMNKIPAKYLVIAPNKDEKKAWVISYEGKKYVESMG